MTSNRLGDINYRLGLSTQTYHQLNPGPNKWFILPTRLRLVLQNNLV